MLVFSGNNTLRCVDDEKQYRVYWCIIVIDKEQANSFAVSEEDLDGMEPILFDSYEDFISWKEDEWEDNMELWDASGQIPIVVPLRVFDA